MRIVSAGLIGLVFGTGIVLSGMANPAKVLNFFDLAGTWDPSLLLVMVAALTVTFVGYRFVLRRDKPAFAVKFHLPASRSIDPSLVLGSAVFGIGWGLSGFCPGGAVPALGLWEPAAWTFVGAMLAGIAAARIARFTFAARSVRTA
ncbi:MAG: permease [Pelagibacterium sp. SCN 63-23]|nr:MAG: permease [Pelagibacterium sp. SCN 63-23]